jgi:hypothetical protein
VTWVVDEGVRAETPPVGDDSRHRHVPATEDHVPESVEEHHIVVWLLSELAKPDPSGETYDAKGTVLIENSATTSRRGAGLVPRGPQGHGPKGTSGAWRAYDGRQGRRPADPPTRRPADPLKIPSAKA